MAMKEFLLVFRMDILTIEMQPTRAQMKLYMEQWNHWIESINADGIVTGGNHLSKKGKVLLPGNKENAGPYVSNKQSIAGYLTIKTKTERSAIAIAKRCPILHGKRTSVEVRCITLVNQK